MDEFVPNLDTEFQIGLSSFGRMTRRRSTRRFFQFCHGLGGVVGAVSDFVRRFVWFFVSARLGSPRVDYMAMKLKGESPESG